MAAKPSLMESRRAICSKRASRGAVAAAKYAGKRIKSTGSIILTNGIIGLHPQKGWVIAAGICGALEAVTRALGRVGEPEDLAETYLYLMRERFSTGAMIVVDGGSTLV